jgi:hypothetical protein
LLLALGPLLVLVRLTLLLLAATALATLLLLTRLVLVLLIILAGILVLLVRHWARSFACDAWVGTTEKRSAAAMVAPYRLFPRGHRGATWWPRCDAGTQGGNARQLEIA